MEDGSRFLSGLGVGAGLMYLFDPRAGRLRRARARDQLTHGRHRASEAIETGARDLRHRSRGLLARLRGAVQRRSEAPDDEILEERVRAALGHVSSHPHALEVVADHGNVHLAGPILSAEREAACAAARVVPGVRKLTDHLEPHDDPDGISALQGGHPRPGQRSVLERSWRPATRLVAGTAGAGLLLAGARRFAGGLPGWAGALLLTRSVFNRPLGQLVGLGARRRGVDVRKTIHVRAPLQEVFALFSSMESFPRFMTHVKEVRKLDERRSHWCVGPFEWDAELTSHEPNRLISWRSLPGSPVESAGVVRFGSDGDGTRIEVRLSYRPPAGMVGHGVARLLGADPKRQMDDDLLRLKSLLEQGKATGRTATVTRAELEPGHA
jgi:uncharacterized membrane protein